MLFAIPLIATFNTAVISMASNARSAFLSQSHLVEKTSRYKLRTETDPPFGVTQESLPQYLDPQNNLYKKFYI